MADALKTGRAISDYPSTDDQYGDRERAGWGMALNDGGIEEGRGWPKEGGSDAAGAGRDDGVGPSSAPPPEVLLQQGQGSTPGQYTPEEYALYCEQVGSYRHPSDDSFVRLTGSLLKPLSLLVPLFTRYVVASNCLRSSIPTEPTSRSITLGMVWTLLRCRLRHLRR